MKNRIGIVGATGYVGMELLRLLVLHKEIEITTLVSRSFAGQPFSQVYPSFRGLIDTNLRELSVSDLARECDLVVTALPHGVSSQIVPQLLDKGLKVLDHSGDFRYRDAAVYKEAYKLAHPQEDLLEKAVYGLPEIYREEIKGASLTANPGCYPTCSLLGLLPLLRQQLIDTKNIIIDAYTGVTGAGRSTNLAFSFCETEGNLKPYNVVQHRHTSEIEQEAGFMAGQKDPLTLTFTPHLAPVKRGILATIYADLAPGATAQTIEAAYADAYAKEQFVRVLPKGALPETKNVAYTNFADIGWTIDERTNKIKIMSAIDNLGKGAAGQALQSINLMMGFAENAGLIAAGGAI